MSRRMRFRNGRPITFLLRIASLALVVLTSAGIAKEQPTTAPAPATAPAEEVVDKEGWTPSLLQVSEGIRALSQPIFIWASRHDHRLPPSLGETIWVRWDASVYLTPADRARIDRLPNPPSAEWVNEHTSYVYLAADVSLKAFALPPLRKDNTIILHTKLDAPLHHPKQGEVIMVLYDSGGCECLPLAMARTRIETCKKDLDAVRDADGGR